MAEFKIFHADEVLKRTREMLANERDWTQGVMRRSAGAGNAPRRCLLSALVDANLELNGERHVIGGDKVKAAPAVKALTFIQAAIRETMNGAEHPEWLPGSSVTSWNDKPGRTHAEVLALLVRAKNLFMNAKGPR